MPPATCWTAHAAAAKHSGGRYSLVARAAAPVGREKVSRSAADHRKRLEELRDQLTDAIAESGARDKAPLAGQLRAVLNDIAALPDSTEASGVDDLAAKRRARRVPNSSAS
jgi:hypothetical protein